MAASECNVPFQVSAPRSPYPHLRRVFHDVVEDADGDSALLGVVRNE